MSKRIKINVFILAFCLFFGVTYGNCVSKIINKKTETGQLSKGTVKTYMVGHLKLVRIEPIKVIINSNMIEKLVEIKWDWEKTHTYLGKEDNTFLYYKQYYKKGIKLRILNRKVFNVLFNSKYKGNIIQNISMNSRKKDIVNILGEPQFESDKENVFGYKTGHFYIFFIGKDKLKEVSVYRLENMENSNSLLNLGKKAQEFCPDSVFYIKTMMEKYMNDYSVHTSGGNDDSYYCYTKGLKVFFSITEDGRLFKRFTLYSNFQGFIKEGIALPEDYRKIQEIKDDKDTRYEFKLDKDFIFEAEKERISEIRPDYVGKRVLSADGTKILHYGDSYDIQGSRIGIEDLKLENPDFEINPYNFSQQFITGADWINDKYFAFTCLGNIYVYDLSRSRLNIVFRAEKMLIRLISVKNGSIKYSDSFKGEEAVYTVKYKFDKNNDLLIGETKW